MPESRPHVDQSIMEAIMNQIATIIAIWPKLSRNACANCNLGTRELSLVKFLEFFLVRIPG